MILGWRGGQTTIEEYLISFPFETLGLVLLWVIMQRVQPFTLLNPATSGSSHIIYKHHWLGSTEPYIILPAIWSWTLSLLLRTFLFPSGTSSSLFHLPNCAGCFRCFLVQSNQAFLGLSVTFCLDLVAFVKTSLDCRPWKGCAHLHKIVLQLK